MAKTYCLLNSTNGGWKEGGVTLPLIAARFSVFISLS